MAQPKDIARAGARIGLGVIGVAVAALTVGAALVVNPPTHSTAPLATRVTPVPTAATAACPGPLLALDPNSTTPALASFGAASLSVGTPAAAASRRELASPADTAAGQHGAPLAYSVPAEPGQDGGPVIAVAQSQNATQDELSGFTAADCIAPSSDSWLSAGSTSLGQNSTVLLNNPGGVAATVSLQVYSEQGAVDAAAARGIVVQPGTQSAVSLAGIAPNVQASVIHVTASGGTVAAYLEQSLVSGVTPQGAELSGPTEAPSGQLVFPGVVFPAAADAPAAGATAGGGSSADAGDDDASPATPVLRVYVPGSQPAKLSIAFAGEQGTGLSGAQSVSVSGGVVSEVPLDRTAPGGYEVTVESDRPIVASIRTSATGTAATDFAWFAAARPLAQTAVAAVADGPNPVLHLANTTSAAVKATVTGADGTARSVSVPAGSGLALPVLRGRLALSGTEGLYASIGYSGDGRLASYRISPAGGDAAAVTVYTK